MKTKTFILWMLSLATIDQLVKAVIRTFYMDTTFAILPPLFYFDPVVNVNYSYINHLFSLGLGKGIHLFVLGFAFCCWLLLYDYFHTFLRYNKSIHVGMLVGFAGLICYFIDMTFLGGSLDYIYLKPLFIFDLKDVYLNCFVVFLLYFFIANANHPTTKTIFGSQNITTHFRNRLKRGQR